MEWSEGRTETRRRGIGDWGIGAYWARSMDLMWKATERGIGRLDVDLITFGGSSSD